MISSLLGLTVKTRIDGRRAMSLQFPLVVRRCVFFFFSSQLRGEFAIARLPLSQRGNYNDIAPALYSSFYGTDTLIVRPARGSSILP